jgi:hypothetical protein
MVARHGDEGCVIWQVSLFDQLVQSFTVGTGERDAAIADVVGQRKCGTVKHVDAHYAPVGRIGQSLNANCALLLNFLSRKGNKLTVIVNLPVDYEWELSGLIPVVDLVEVYKVVLVVVLYLKD